MWSPWIDRELCPIFSSFRDPSYAHFFEALSEMKSPCVHQLIQLLSRSNITLAHISLTEASCLFPHGIVEWKCIVPPMCAGVRAAGIWGTSTSGYCSWPLCQPLTPRFLPHGLLFSWEVVHALGQVTSANSSEAKCALSPSGRASMWYGAHAGMTCQLRAEAVDVACVIWVEFFPDGKFRLLMLWFQSEKRYNVDLQPGTGFDSTLTFYLPIALCAVGHWHLTVLLPARAYFTPWNLELRKPGLEC